MDALIVLLYVVALVSFVPATVLAACLWFQGRAPLAAKFLRFEAAYLLFLAALLGAYVGLTLPGASVLAVETFFNVLFFLLYAGVLFTLSQFLMELLQKPWQGGGRRLVEILVLLSALIPLAVSALVYEGPDRVVALRWWLNGVFFVVFLAVLSGFFALSLWNRGRLRDEWKRRTLSGACVIFVAGIPFFLVDALWPTFQLDHGWIARGLNLELIPAVAWNLWFTVRWFRFPANEEVPSSDLEPTSGLIDILTQRERDLARLIVKGLSNQEISDELGVSLSTTKNHIYNIFNKTGASSRKELSQMLTRD